MEFVRTFLYSEKFLGVLLRRREECNLIQILDRCKKGATESRPLSPSLRSKVNNAEGCHYTAIFVTFGFSFVGWVKRVIPTTLLRPYIVPISLR